MNFEASWTTPACDVVSLACDYYGGLARWRTLSKVRLLPDRLSGLVPWLKGAERTFPIPSAFEVSPQERVTRFIDYPTPGQVGIFSDGAVRIVSADGATLVASANHRQSFRGLARLRRWSPLDALYFFGYALAHYHTLPFTLPEARLLAIKHTGPRHARTTVLSVEFPPHLHTHCRRQRFYFDPQGQLLRHDYQTEIIGTWARGAHYWKRQTRCNGFPVALERHVLARVGSRPTPLTALRATFVGAEVEFEPRTGAL